MIKAQSPIDRAQSLASGSGALFFRPKLDLDDAGLFCEGSEASDHQQGALGQGRGRVCVSTAQQQLNHQHCFHHKSQISHYSSRYKEN